ncbi:MAG TPA: hypothetical protein VE263_00990 [Candidatus Angelobacter sp.]|nr:hypothetical protein [Candidatus Angelobacter sp.]
MDEVMELAEELLDVLACSDASDMIKLAALLSVIAELSGESSLELTT